jgi:uncharacterized protein YrrD
VTVRLGRILGLPAVWGEQIVGHVERAVPDERGQCIRGFIIRRGLGGARWAAGSTITLLGDVSVILQHKPARIPRGQYVQLGTVKDESGLTLGLITDLWISRDSLAITALEVTLGPMEDLLTGRRTVHAWAVRPGEDGPQVLIPRTEWEEGRESDEQAALGRGHGHDGRHGADDVPHGQNAPPRSAAGHEQSPPHG